MLKLDKFDLIYLIDFRMKLDDFLLDIFCHVDLRITDTKNDPFFGQDVESRDVAFGFFFK